MIAQIVTFSILGLVLWAPGQAEDVNLVCSRVSKAIQLTGSDSINLTGSENSINVTGKGGSIQIVGSNNNFTLDADVDSVQVVGSNNTIRLIRKPNRRKPSWQSMGTNNALTEVNQ